MKLYDFSHAPNCRRVRVFAAEKGLDLECVPVDMTKREQMSDDYARINDRMLLPMLELEDGTRLHESGAICRYLEEMHPEPPLFGTDPLERARVEAWNRRVELEGLTAAAEVLRNASRHFADRALPGPRNYAQIPELAERGRQRLDVFYDALDRQLGETPYLAGDRFSIADILALVVVDFAASAGRHPAPEGAANLGRWHADVSARPSAKA
ncbi:glutathione S-transferase family protein [Pseudooceanicola aestuarii]|uniref:glutathione S-transferase family protein n=1 Tax=Pseudooceanicola aestuarii TaxID=2697319 RepID=UPI0013D700C1|nr:glutathione S-transferase [Pseudooceanicola aestuarii]